MLARLRSQRPSHATVVAYLALIVALGGSAYAATALPAGSVGTTQIRAGAVSAAKLQRHAVTARAVADHSLTGLQIDASTLGLVPAASRAANADHASVADRAASATTAGHATTADSASDATHAASADNATNAVHASDSDSLGGAPASSYVPTCPDSTISADGLCIELGIRNVATWPTALQTCSSLGRRLPTPAELAIAFDHFGALNEGQWTSQVGYDDNGALYAVAMGQTLSRTLSFFKNDMVITIRYRCVFTPTAS